MTELIKYEETAPVQVDMFAMPPIQKMQYAGQVANVLKDVIDKQNLYTKIGPSKHVNIEGWSTLGSILGILPKEDKVIKLDCGGYEAHVNLIRASDGVIVGGASSICSRSEKTWSKRDDYAVRSMAITRATGKAYRLAFAWIITLAGYSGTPLEEMPIEMIRPSRQRSEGFDPNNTNHIAFIKSKFPELDKLDSAKQDEIFKTIKGKSGQDVEDIIKAMI